MRLSFLCWTVFLIVHANCYSYGYGSRRLKKRSTDEIFDTLDTAIAGKRNVVDTLTKQVVSKSRNAFDTVRHATRDAVDTLTTKTFDALNTVRDAAADAVETVISTKRKIAGQGCGSGKLETGAEREPQQSDFCCDAIGCGPGCAFYVDGTCDRCCCDFFGCGVACAFYADGTCDRCFRSGLSLGDNQENSNTCPLASNRQVVDILTTKTRNIFNAVRDATLDAVGTAAEKTKDIVNIVADTTNEFVQAKINIGGTVKQGLIKLAAKKHLPILAKKTAIITKTAAIANSNSDLDDDMVIEVTSSDVIELPEVVSNEINDSDAHVSGTIGASNFKGIDIETGRKRRSASKNYGHSAEESYKPDPHTSYRVAKGIYNGVVDHSHPRDVSHIPEYHHRSKHSYEAKHPTSSYEVADRPDPHMNPSDMCDKSSINYMPYHPRCKMPEVPDDKCNESSVNYKPNHPDCADKCDETSVNYMPNHPDCMMPEVPDEMPETPKDLCNETSVDFSPNHPDCADKCSDTSINFMPNHPDCIDIPDPEEPERCLDPCDEACENFDPEDPSCNPDEEPEDPEEPEEPEVPEEPEPLCVAMLSGINTTLCEVSEEYEAMTCGECLDVETEIQVLTESCKTQSADLIDCVARIGSVEKDGMTCKMFDFKFRRSTMSSKCLKPKPKYPSYVPKHVPVYQKPRYQHQIRSTYAKKGYPNHGRYIKSGQYPRNYKAPRKLYKPKNMVTVLRKRYW